jgi:cell wall-associated NlpC family hydrolase
MSSQLRAHSARPDNPRPELAPLAELDPESASQEQARQALAEWQQQVAERSPGRALPGDVRQRLEASFGCDLSGVTLHTDEQASLLAEAMGACAVTCSQDIFFGDGELSTSSDDGLALLAQEVHHTRQQGPTAAPITSVSSPSDSGEREAHEAADAAVEGEVAPEASRVRGVAQREAASPITGTDPLSLMQRVVHDSLSAIAPADPAKKRTLDLLNGSSDDEQALRNLWSYAFAHPTGPLPDQPDASFGQRLMTATLAIKSEMERAESHDKLPPRLQAIVFAALEMNMDPLSGTDSDADQRWMTTRPGSVGQRNPGASDSVSGFGEGAWKCNKMVTDSYATAKGAGVGRSNLPIKKSDSGWWGPQANDLAGSGKLKNLVHAERDVLTDDGLSVAEHIAYDAKGNELRKWVRDEGAGVYVEYEKQKGRWQATGATRPLADMELGAQASAGDIVSFHNKEKGASGHTGLFLGQDLFISALNATHGVGIVSVQMHLNPNAWDHYDQVSFRKYSGK